MDLITISKLLNIFKRDSIANLRRYMLDDEINALEQYRIVSKLPNGNFSLSRKRLYMFAKECRENNNIDLAVMILKYLVSLRDTDARIWAPTNNYQLFKCYLLIGDLNSAHECFKRGYKRESQLYPIIVDTFDYILKKDKEMVIEDDTINTLYNNRQFNDIYKKLEEECDSDSHKEQLKFVIDRASDIITHIDKKITNFINNNQIDELRLYFDKLKIVKRTDNTIRYMEKMLDIYDNLSKGIMDDRITELVKNIDYYRSSAVSKIIKDNNLSTMYTSSLTMLIKYLYKKVVNSKYKYYIKSEATRKANIVENNNEIIILNNLADKDDLNLYHLTNKKPTCDATIVYSNDDKKVVISNNNHHYETNINRVKDLYNKGKYKESLVYSLRLITMDPTNNVEGYLYASFNYAKLKMVYEAERFNEMYEFLTNNQKENGLKKDFNFYGIKDLDKIMNLYQKHNISIDLACISYGYTAEDINIVKLLIAKYYYSIGDMENGDLYYEAATTSKYQNEITKFLTKEVDSIRSYQNIDYEEAKSFINKLEKK